MGTLRRLSRVRHTITQRAWVVHATRVGTASEIGFVQYQIQVQRATYTAFQWDPPGQVLQPVPIGTQVELVGHWTGMPGKSTIHLHIMAPVEITRSSLASILHQSPRQDLIGPLMRCIQLLQPALRQFVTGVLMDPAIGVPFVTLPASLSYHHAEPGGLLAHSWECASICGKAAHGMLNRKEAELTVVAALLHDVGKIRTYKGGCTLSDTGHTVPHEALTLEVLSPHLARLDKDCRLGANFIRHMLTWDTTQSRYPEFPGALLIRAADQFSTAINCRTAAFESHPDYHWKAGSKQPKQPSFLRIPN